MKQLGGWEGNRLAAAGAGAECVVLDFQDVDD
jgi:hypothetical protein